jgi:hypothetical protein
MEKKKTKLSLLFVALLLFCGAGIAFGDWDEGGPHKMHYPQLPDPCGWDVNFNADAMFDDWMCSESGYVTDIHFWLSCKGDVWDPELTGEPCPIARLLIYIYADMPADDPCNQCEYSHPTGPALWSIDINPFDANLIRHAGTGQQGWIDWQQEPYPLVIDNDHVHYYQINVTDIPEPFFQEENTIYWLGIHLHTYDDELWTFGWKSSQDHWNDNAVYFYGGWDEMYDPCTAEPMDLAFVITSEEQEPNEVKWIQNPDLNDTGIDVDSSVDFMWQAPWANHILADDFNCTRTEPITDIHIWGSWYHDILPLGDPYNVVFFLFIHEDLPVGDPCNPYDYSIPGEILWGRPFGPGEFHVAVEAAGITEGYFVPEANYFEADADQTCWRYDFYIDPYQAFIQQGTAEDPCVYWLSVQAGTDSELSPARFGWKTSLNHWNDDAVFLALDLNEPDPNWYELRYPQGHIFEGESIDLAFSITTGQEEPNEPNGPEPEEPNFTKPLMPHTKWSQPPIEIDPNSNEPNYCGWDEDSVNIGIWRIVADDFRCLGTMPITSVHWWGSYLNWEGNEPPPVQPKAWQIGFWSNIADPDPCNPNTFSHPNELLWKIDVNQTIGINPMGEPSLISYWRFNENEGYDVNDSANGNNGTIYPEYNVDSMWTIGKEGSALYFHGGKQFDSDADEVRVPHSASLDITYPFTVEAWIKAEGTRKYHAIVDKYDGSATLQYGFTFYLTDGNLRLSIYGGTCGNGNMAVPLIDLRDNKWHHVAGLWDGVYIKLYIDGELKAQNPCPCDPASTTHELGIGKRLYGWGGYLPFEGTIDEVAIYDVNLTDDRIKQHYEAGSAGYVDVEKCGDIYQYSLQLEPSDCFWQDDYNEVTEDNTFWMSIVAVYPNDVIVEFPWGWHTKPWHWMDDAVVFSHDPCTGPLVPGMTVDPCYIEPIKDPCGESFDMAFELDTDPNYIKWEQLYTGIRNWPHYEDVNSIFSSSDPNGDRLVADDWRCVRRTPITAIVWWGSYIGYGYEACTGPVPRPRQPDYFWLAIWTDVPAGTDPCYPFSHPGEPIWGYEAFEYDEVLVGYDKLPHGEPNEPVFRYSVRLPEENWFHQPDYNEVFWLSVQATYDTYQPNYPWGWTNHEHVFNDDAVQLHHDMVLGWVWDKLKDQTGASADTSFMLFTDPYVCSPCANYNLDASVNFIDYAEFANEWYWAGPDGGYNNGDLDCDGDVDLHDLDIFCQQWLQHCP